MIEMDLNTVISIGILILCVVIIAGLIWSAWREDHRTGAGTTKPDDKGLVSHFITKEELRPKAKAKQWEDGPDGLPRRATQPKVAPRPMSDDPAWTLKPKAKPKSKRKPRRTSARRRSIERGH